MGYLESSHSFRVVRAVERMRGREKNRRPIERKIVVASILMDIFDRFLFIFFFFFLVGNDAMKVMDSKN